MLKNKNLNHLITIAISLFLASNSVSAHDMNHLGHIHFPTSGKTIAKPAFEKGMMLLHSFQYDEARESFLKAEQLDPNFALAYWGEALTYNHPIWNEQEYDKAIIGLNKFAPTAESRLKKAKTPKEKGLINAVNQLYGTGDKITRDNNYADAMRELYRLYPNDDEIAILYSLALLGTAESERNTKTYMQAAAVAEDIYQRNQSHPGALHYAIHAYDDPIHAPLGLRAARAYAKVAPASAHALHMPSHIFAALGMWDDVIKSNQAAWEAGLKLNKKNDPKAFTIHDVHALQWLAYAHLQKKHYPTALHLTKIMENIAIQANTPQTKWYYAQMRAAYIAESGDYQAPLKTIPMQNIELSAYANAIYTDMLIEKQKNAISSMQRLLDELIKKTPSKITKNTYNDYFTSITSSGITVMHIVELQIKAQIAFCNKRYQEAIRFLRQATKLEEDNVSYGYGPPIPVKPSFELLAEFLADQKQYKEAYQEYILTLKRFPNRSIALTGLEKSKQNLLELGVPVPDGIKPYFHRLILPEYYH